MRYFIKGVAALVLVTVSFVASAQRYSDGIIDKTVAIVGNEVIMLSQLEEEVQMMAAYGMMSDKNGRCELLETMMSSKLFLMQARLDSLEVNKDNVEMMLTQQMDNVRQQLGGDKQVEEYFGKPLYKLRQEWKENFRDQALTQQMRQEITGKLPSLTPQDVKEYIERTDPEDLPMVPIKYQLSQICVYPDREAAALAVKERLLALRERVMNGEKFSTLARIYSQDPGSALRGGELGMAPKSIFWPAFSDAAMALKPGVVSQIVETPDGFHLIDVIEKDGDMFNARHILLKPEYTADDRDEGFKLLDSLRTEILAENMTFDVAAWAYSEDLASRTNGGQMADPSTGSSYFEIDGLKPQDYAAIRDLKVGEISRPIESLDNEGYEANRDGNLVYKIVKVDKILPAHTASFSNDYTLLLEQAQAEQAQKAIDEFIESKIASTYIIIDPLFGDCDFEKAGWKEKVRK